jgi:hypothetical protein
MLKGKILTYETYLITPPYPARWPRVFEICYEPHPDEFGKQPRFGCLSDSGHVSYIDPAPFNQQDTTFVELAGHDVPLKYFLSMEDCYFDLLGKERYHQNPSIGICITHLIIMRDGEELAHYAAARVDMPLAPELITFDEPIRVPTVRELLTLTSIEEHASAFPRPIDEMYAQRRRDGEHTWIRAHKGVARATTLDYDSSVSYVERTELTEGSKLWIDLRDESAKTLTNVPPSEQGVAERRAIDGVEFPQVEVRLSRPPIAVVTRVPSASDPTLEFELL